MSRMTINFVTLTETLLRVKEGTLNNYVGITGIMWNYCRQAKINIILLIGTGQLGELIFSSVCLCRIYLVDHLDKIGGLPSRGDRM